MATTETQELGCDINNESVLSRSGRREEQMSPSGGKKGGWITVPFLIGSLAGMAISGGAVTANLIVYLIREFHISSIDAAQISNVVNGCSCFFPVAGAIIADSYLGCFPVVSISSFVTLLGMVVLVLTATVDSLKPPPCFVGAGSSLCAPPSAAQYAVLYSGLAVVTIGWGGWRFCIATMGANQFVEDKDRESFFNWFFVASYMASVVASTVIVYVQDNLSWGLGFGLCLALGSAALVLFLLGKRFYREDKPLGSPFVDLARVVVACVKKRKIAVSSRTTEDYYHGEGSDSNNMVEETPSKSFRFLNKAAVRGQGDLTNEGKISKPWRLCTVQQVEDLKALLRISPLWLSTVFLSTPIAVQMSLTVLQALAMDRHVGPHFQIPAGSIMVVVLVTTAAYLPVLDPAWRALTRGHSLTPLQRIGVGHILNVLSMVVSALVESRRLEQAHDNRPMRVFWLFPQLVLVGLGEAFHFPGQVSLYYQEFPDSLRNTSTAMVSMVIGVSFYTGTALIDLVRRSTAWLPDDIDRGRLDNLYWLVVLLGVLNFGYYLVCAKLYKYQHIINHANNSASK